MLKSFKYAVEGILFCVKTQRNFRVHIVMAMWASLLAFLFKLGRGETLTIVFTITFVIICEMFNTAIEQAFDLVTTEWKKPVKIAKDVSAGAVLVSAVVAVIVGFVLFFDITKIIEIVQMVRQSPLNILIFVLLAVLSVVFVV